MDRIRRLKIKNCLSVIRDKQVTDTDESIKKIELLCNCFGAHSDDPLIMLFAVCNEYHSALAKTPLQIQEIIAGETEKYSEKQHTEKKNFLDEIAEQIKLAIKKEKVITMLKWGFFSSAFFICMTAGMSYFLYTTIYSEAFESAYYRAYVEYEFQDTWAKNSDLINKVIELDKIGSLENIVNCSGEGWEIQEANGRTACFPREGGWYMK